MPTLNTLSSDVYHLLPMCHVYFKVKKWSSASDSISFFWIPLCTHFKLTPRPTLIYLDKNIGVEVQLFVHCKEIRDKRRQCFGPKHSPIRHFCGSPPFTSIIKKKSWKYVRKTLEHSGSISSCNHSPVDNFRRSHALYHRSLLIAQACIL